MSIRTKSLRTLAGIAAGLAIATITLKASDPLGVYCVVQKVVMAPDEVQPTTAQIWGACSLATGGMQDDRTYQTAWYSDPLAGYLYYSAPAGKQEVAIKEWKDLKSVAGTGEIVAFGGRYMRNGRIRFSDEKPIGPDVYPIQMGVFKMSAYRVGPAPTGSSYPDFFASLRKAAGVK
jgi:hypothetical protein